MDIQKQLFKIVCSHRYRYAPEKFKGTFLDNTYETSQTKPVQPLEKKIFCFWTNDVEMSENRLNALRTLRGKAGMELVLVTPSNLEEYIVPGFPLHKGYPYLSAVHKSDYLRCYFMHHYGGGYTDVKSCKNSWKHSFDRLEKRPEKWILGYREIGKKGVAVVDHPVLADVLNENWHLLLGNGAYLCRPYTPFTAEWYNELHHRMDAYYEQLTKYPGNTMGDNQGYPIAWTEILGQIFHPLCLKYQTKLIYSDKVKPNIHHYR